MRPMIAITSICLGAGLTALAPTTAHGFCGFYVSGASGEMFNNATQVVLMREGTRTVLSMQNNYQGPPENFAMVVPVPVVLQEDNVKTLDKAIFKRVDQLAAPRLVEYWEEDPCEFVEYEKLADGMALSEGKMGNEPRTSSGSFGVTIEAKFSVGEYEIVILSAKDATGLDSWLKVEKYQIPQGAAPLFKPYVEAGSKFFVAKVDTSKVTFKDGMASLSPLRFYYDSEEFSLPVRLGLINSAGTQDLIVHILAQGKRYEVANYKNVTIPTNLDVRDDVRNRFGEFYAALFDATLEKNPGAVVTEYSWDASSCDPCPTPALSPAELATLGQDVLYAGKAEQPARRRWSGFVLTRLHARYGKADMANDLVFKEAKGIAGGREVRISGALEHGAKDSRINNFQGRYAIRHPWTGPIECKNPRRGRWGGPPAGVRGSSSPKPALDLAFAPRGKTALASFVRRDIPELAVKAAADQAPAASTDTAKAGSSSTGNPPAKDGSAKDRKKSSKGCSTSSGTGGPLFALLALVGLTLWRRRSHDAG